MQLGNSGCNLIDKAAWTAAHSGDQLFCQEKHRNGLFEKLSDPCLFRQLAYFDGKWQSSAHGDTFEVKDPADGSLIGRVQKLGAEETRRAIQGAEETFLAWRERLPQDRADLLRTWGRLMQENRHDLALIITAEQGKPLHESLEEIDYAAEFLDWFAGEAMRLNGEIVAGHLPRRRMLVSRQPVGVTAAITPWNFPSAMITRKAGAALAAGCTILVRPASETPYSALALAELADRAGIPAGVFSVIPGSREIVSELCSHPAVKAVSFTGSTEVGRALMRQAADTVKKLSLELGGHAPFIVFPDVSVDDAVEGALAAKFQTSGQDCLAANRMYVHEDMYGEFLRKFTERVKQLHVGNGLEEDTDIGPLMNPGAIRKCREHVEDAVNKGARLLCGGTTHRAGEQFFTPTVLAGVTPTMKITREETFGPVAAVMPFVDEKDLADNVNHPQLGLIAYLFTRDHDRICRMTDLLEYGMVAVNCVKVTGGPIPFGGVKQSGLGREGGRWGVDEFLDTKYICSAYAAAG